jgi:hypothetical protein
MQGETMDGDTRNEMLAKLHPLHNRLREDENCPPALFDLLGLLIDLVCSPTLPSEEVTKPDMTTVPRRETPPPFSSETTRKILEEGKRSK